MTIDIKFKQDKDGEWDIDFANGDFEMTNGLDTALYMSILGDKRAAASQVTEPVFRRGHFTDQFNDIIGYQVGSLFWYYTEQNKNTQTNLSLIDSAVTDGTKWFLDDKILSEIKLDIKSFKDKVTIGADLINKFQKNSQYYNLFIAT